jgi:hypothetical protein
LPERTRVPDPDPPRRHVRLGMTYAEQMAQAVDYDNAGEGSVDSLVAYKNALEDTLESVEHVLRSQGLTIEDLFARPAIPDP